MSNPSTSANATNATNATSDADARAINATSDTTDPSHIADVSLSLIVHRPVADNQRGVLCPQCENAYLLNCGPRLFYCPMCGSASIFQHGPASIEVVTAHALVTAARSVLAERMYWVAEVDARDQRIAELERELAMRRLLGDGSDHDRDEDGDRHERP